MGFDPDVTGVGADLIFSQKSALTQAADQGKLVGPSLATNHTAIVPLVEAMFHGMADYIEADGTVSVKARGFVTVLYTGAAPGLGYTELVANGAGGVKVPAVPGTGKKFIVTAVDAVATTVTFLLG